MCLKVTESMCTLLWTGEHLMWPCKRFVTLRKEPSNLKLEGSQSLPELLVLLQAVPWKTFCCTCPHTGAGQSCFLLCGIKAEQVCFLFPPGISAPYAGSIYL